MNSNLRTPWASKTETKARVRVGADSHVRGPRAGRCGGRSPSSASARWCPRRSFRSAGGWYCDHRRSRPGSAAEILCAAPSGPVTVGGDAIGGVHERLGRGGPPAGTSTPAKRSRPGQAAARRRAAG